jgi:hypothetical protein
LLSDKINWHGETQKKTKGPVTTGMVSLTVVNIWLASFIKHTELKRSTIVSQCFPLDKERTCSFKKEHYLLGCDTMQFNSSSPMFSRNTVYIFMVEELSQASNQQVTLVNPEDGGSMFLQSLSFYLDYTASHPRRQYSQKYSLFKYALQYNVECDLNVCHSP